MTAEQVWGRAPEKERVPPTGKPVVKGLPKGFQSEREKEQGEKRRKS